MKRSVRLAAALLALMTAAACAAARLERLLDPDSRDFLSKVRYIITREERRMFRNLPAAARPAFVNDFWTKRDPDPSTEENEFKIQYFQRLEEANFLFNEGRGSEPGWLQDRGRIYILLGQPDERQQFPRGMTFYDIPTEIWLYGWFPIVFRDPNWNGNYRLEADSAIQLAEIMKTQLAWKPEVKAQAGILEFKTELRVEAKGKALLRVLVPYRKIWFKDEEGTLTAVLTIKAEALDAKDVRLWETTTEKPLRFTPEELTKIGRGKIAIEIPLSLPAGKSVLEVTLTNSGDGAKISKRVPVKN
ncbi:MAG: GWxTD domain-containing protein [Candidatus Aminicenantes bacterium]|nr:GWxTD domain-containing protein [Candidatus Aminicenantes bacterium]